MDNKQLIQMAKYNTDTEGILALQQDFKVLKSEISKKIIGQENTVNLVLMSIFSDAHSILVGVPGLAKTLLIKTISEVLDLNFKRIQFVPDLMPSDIIGTEILDETKHFRFNKGPIFANIILADEINRTPPKTQAALLEAMQEKTVTAAGILYELEPPFFVLATQNPIEQEGTYPLPEAQLDRFMFNIDLGYPSFEEELNIVRQTTSGDIQQTRKILNKEEIIAYQKLIQKLPVTDNLINYAVNLVASTRPNTPKAAKIVNEFVAWGAGPRASQALIIAAKTHAAIHGKFSPDIEDIRAVALPILKHRVIKNFKAEAEGVSLEKILEHLQ
jgi:MoxR-like ATPase